MEEALTQSQDGRFITPNTQDDWNDWVSATRTRNHALEDPLLDWLDLYGEAKGFTKDIDLPGYDARADFAEFIFRKGAQFEEAVVSHLKTLTPIDLNT